MEKSKQCKGHCLLCLPVEEGPIEIQYLSRRDRFGNRANECGVLRASARQKDLRDRLRDESVICIANASRRQRDGCCDCVLVRRPRRLSTAGCDEVVGVLLAEKLGSRRFRRCSTKVFGGEKALDH